MAAFLSVFPLLSSQIISGAARTVIILSLSLLIIVPLAPQVLSQGTLDPWMITLILAKEIFIGIIFGLVSGFLFFVVESTGSLIDTQRGTSIAEVLNPGSGNQVSPIGLYFFQYVSILFFITGGILILLESFYMSYQVWPVMTGFPQIDERMVQLILSFLQKLMAMMLVFAAPICIAMFLAQLALGLMNRFAQQLNVFSVSMPVMSGVAFFLLVYYIGVLHYLFIRNIDHIPSDWIRLRDALNLLP